MGIRERIFGKREYRLDIKDALRMGRGWGNNAPTWVADSRGRVSLPETVIGWSVGDTLGRRHTSERTGCVTLLPLSGEEISRRSSQLMEEYQSAIRSGDRRRIRRVGAKMEEMTGNRVRIVERKVKR